VARYVDMAAKCVDDILARGKLPILAGGTGLYIDSLLSGRTFSAFSPESPLRGELEGRIKAEGGQVLLDELAKVDPEAAARLHPNDAKRIVRALEVYLTTGKTITQHNLETKAIAPKYRPLWIGLDYVNRQDLYDRIDRRVTVMLEHGLVEEIKSLLASGIPADCTAMQAIGYKEFIEALDNRCTIEEAADRVRQSSRRYAKRQLTWFRRNPAMHWLRRSKTDGTAEIMEKARQILRDSDK